MRSLGLVIPILCGLLACNNDDTAGATDGGETAGVTSEDGASTGSVTEAETQTGRDRSTTTSASATGTSGAGETQADEAGTESSGGPMPEVDWSFAPVLGRANVDDDDDNGKEDWLDMPFDGDNELATMVLPGAVLGALPAGARVRLSLGGTGEALRAWQGDTIVLGGTQGAPILEYVLSPTGEDVVLRWEFSGHNTRAELTITWLDESDAEVESFVATVRASPLITNHHLQPAEQAWVVDVAGGPSYNNQSMVAAMTAVLGERLTRVPDSQYGHDVWIQDEFEWATARSSDGGRMDVVIDSIRDRGLDPLPEATLVGPDYVAQTWGEGQKTTYDSFGNLDASPPVTVDGVFYPFGRVYYGRHEGVGINYKMAEFLASQEVQRPFELDTTWLCVGHVDEYSSVVPDASAPQGFRLLLADVPAMYAILDGLPEDTQLPRYSKDYGYSSIGEITGDAGLRAYNEDIQADHLDGIRAIFKKELGLGDAEIVAVPTIFDQINGCGAVALVPGMMNLAMFNFAGEAARAFVPDPFLRAEDDDPASDPIIEDYKARMPKDLVLHFVDNWSVYHTNLGEVHCGTNVQRAPLADWWEEN